MAAVGLEINQEKSATNTPTLSESATLLEGTKGYKYLGILEDASGRPLEDAKAKVSKEMMHRAETLCKLPLSGKNLFKAINEYSLSLQNYYIGVLPMEPKDYSLLDHEIRQILIRQRIHFQPACKERLYLPRKELGRGLHCLEHRSEAMLLNLYLKLKSEEGLGTRRDAVLKVERDKKSHLALILPYLAEKYASADINPKELASLQNKILYSEIQKKIFTQCCINHVIMSWRILETRLHVSLMAIIEPTEKQPYATYRTATCLAETEEYAHTARSECGQ